MNLFFPMLTEHEDIEEDVIAYNAIINLNNLADAEYYLDFIGEALGENIEVLIRKAYLRYKNYQVQDALSLFDEHPTLTADCRGLILKVKINADMERYEEALHFLQQLDEDSIRRDAHFMHEKDLLLEYYQLYCRVCLELKKYKESLDYVEKCFEFHSGKNIPTELKILKAKSKYYLGEFADAFEDIDETFDDKSAEFLSESLYWRAKIKLELPGQLASSLVDMDRLIADERFSGKAYLLRSEIHHRMQNSYKKTVDELMAYKLKVSLSSTEVPSLKELSRLAFLRGYIEKLDFDPDPTNMAFRFNNLLRRRLNQANITPLTVAAAVSLAENKAPIDIFRKLNRVTLFGSAEQQYECCEISETSEEKQKRKCSSDDNVGNDRKRICFA